MGLYYDRGDALRLDCLQCGAEFEWTATSGPMPKYCPGGKCQQAAYSSSARGTRPGTRRASAAPRRAGHRLQLTLDADVFLWLSRRAWENNEGTATLAGRLLEGAVRAGAAADEVSTGQGPKRQYEFTRVSDAVRHARPVDG